MYCINIHVIEKTDVLYFEVRKRIRTGMPGELDSIVEIFFHPSLAVTCHTTS